MATSLCPHFLAQVVYKNFVAAAIRRYAQGVVLKRSAGTPETRLRQRFTVTQNINSAVLKLSYTAFQ